MRFRILFPALLLLIFVSCNKEKDEKPEPVYAPEPITALPAGETALLSAMYTDGLLTNRFEYDESNRLITLYYYNVNDTLSYLFNKSHFSYRVDGRVSAQSDYQRVGQKWKLLQERLISYEVDTIAFSVAGNITLREKIVQTGKHNRVTGAIGASDNLAYRDYNFTGNDLTYYYSYRLIPNSQPWEDSTRTIKELYRYTTSSNPFWPISKDPRLRHLLLGGQYVRQSAPFAYIISEHNPDMIQIPESDNMKVKGPCKFNYTFLPGSTLPLTQEWLNDGKLYSTFKYEYILGK